MLDEEVRALIRRRLRREVSYHGKRDPRKTEWSPSFERLMRNRLVFGAYRYGRMREAGKPTYDRVKDAQRRLSDYLRDGNLEHLVDAANLCLLEFEEPLHPNAELRSVDDGRHVPMKHD